MLNIHETVYNLSADPFRLTPDHHFAYSHPSYSRSKAYMDYALLQGEGFVMVTGAPGTGKTTLTKEILANVDITSVQVAMLTSTQLRTRDLLQMVATAFSLRFMDADKATLLTALEQFLRQQCQSGRRAVLIVDEAQGLSVSALEELRLLANLQHDNQMLLQVFLLGQEKLRDLISSPGMEQFRQRIVASSHLEPLSLEDTVNYVQFRLDQAGWQGDPEISGDALQLIHKYSGGVPRRINLICTRLLLSGGMRDKHLLDGQDAQDVVLELQREMLIDPDTLELQADVEVEPISSNSSTPDSIPEEASPGEDKSVQRTQARDSAERVTDGTNTQRAAMPKSTGVSGEREVSSRASATRRNNKKAIGNRKRESPAPVERKKETVLKDVMVKPAKEQVRIPSISKRIDKEAVNIRRDSSITSRSISMAAARAAPDSDKGRLNDSLIHGLYEAGSRAKAVASSSEINVRPPAAVAAQKKAKSLRLQLAIFLLAVVPLIVVVGVNFRDYVVTVSAQVDAKGKVHSLISTISNLGDTDEQPELKIMIDDIRTQ